MVASRSARTVSLITAMATVTTATPANAAAYPTPRARILGITARIGGNVSIVIGPRRSSIQRASSPLRFYAKMVPSFVLLGNLKTIFRLRSGGARPGSELLTVPRSGALFETDPQIEIENR